MVCITYLFFVSFLYHVGYWNPFNIDILNYFEFQDAINGILFPIVENLKLIVLIIILMAFVVLSTWPKIKIQNSILAADSQSLTYSDLVAHPANS